MVICLFVNDGFTIGGSLFQQTTSILPQIIAHAIPTLIETNLNPTWKHNPGISKDDIEWLLH